MALSTRTGNVYVQTCVCSLIILILKNYVYPSALMVGAPPRCRLRILFSFISALFAVKFTSPLSRFYIIVQARTIHAQWVLPKNPEQQQQKNTKIKHSSTTNTNNDRDS